MSGQLLALHHQLLVEPICLQQESIVRLLWKSLNMLFHSPHLWGRSLTTLKKSEWVLLGLQFSHYVRWYLERFYCTPKGTFTQQFDQSIGNIRKSNEIQYIPVKKESNTTPKNWQNHGKTKNHFKTYFQALWKWRNPRKEKKTCTNKEKKQRGSRQHLFLFFCFSRDCFWWFSGEKRDVSFSKGWRPYFFPGGGVFFVSKQCRTLLKE